MMKILVGGIKDYLFSLVDRGHLLLLLFIGGGSLRRGMIFGI